MIFLKKVKEIERKTWFFW